MKSKKCNRCYYGEICSERISCDDFDCLSYELITDDEIEQLVRSYEAEYWEAWNSYLKEFATSV